MQAHVNEGHRWVVDIDLAQFFDRVNHDILMSLVAKHVQDKRILRLIRRYLKVGVMDGGVVSPRGEGTPQGGLCEALHKPPYVQLLVMQSIALESSR
jgi:retron-type reverse transcriptase